MPSGRGRLTDGQTRMLETVISFVTEILEITYDDEGPCRSLSKIS